MSATDDDSTLTQLATAWVNLYLGGAKVEEAFFIFQELGDKYSWTVSFAQAASVTHTQLKPQPRLNPRHASQADLRLTSTGISALSSSLCD